jgi:hypothetical protein
VEGYDKQVKRVEISNTRIPNRRWITLKWKDRISKEEESLDLNQGKATSQIDQVVNLRS